MTLCDTVNYILIEIRCKDETGRTIAMDVEPNFSYVGGYGRKTFLPLSRLERIDVKHILLLHDYIS